MHRVVLMLFWGQKLKNNYKNVIVPMKKKSQNLLTNIVCENMKKKRI